MEVGKDGAEWVKLARGNGDETVDQLAMGKWGRGTVCDLGQGPVSN